MSVLVAMTCFILGLAAAARASRSPRTAMHPYPWIAGSARRERSVDGAARAGDASGARGASCVDETTPDHQVPHKSFGIQAPV